jgi:2-polyprenyl-3-methyl-5-hydroxy-6-metoxy-1,4-benzoquinol methylase
MTSGAHTAEAEATEARFEFGENWSRFAERIEPERIEAARVSLIEMVGEERLRGASFLDVGSGSGLFSLAAATLGASQVQSFDFDEASVATTRSVRDAFGGAGKWVVERGDVLDRAYMESLGTWDVVYSWGVLHHTGELWTALDNACSRVRPGGLLFIAIYNDQGPWSRAWLTVKRGYQRVPAELRPAYVALACLPIEIRACLGHLRRGRLREYLRSWRADATYSARGMNRWRDLVDWVGGYPFEWAAPDAIIDRCTRRGFALRRLASAGRSHGCNEFVFELPESAG